MNYNGNGNGRHSHFDSTNLVSFLYSKRKILLIVGVSAAVISAIVSLLITPKFKSTVIMFPTSTSSISKALISENAAGKHDIMEFGEEEQAEQMLQILNSDEIRRRVMEKYNLMEHYDIDTADKYKYTLLNEEYESNVKFKRTEFMSVKIDVLDKDPVLAANMANDIAALSDSVKNRMQKERAREAFQIVEDEYKYTVNHIKEMEDSLARIMKMGVFDYESQAEVFNQQYAIALAKGDKNAVASLEKKLDVLAEYGPAYLSMVGSLEEEIVNLRALKNKYEEVKIDAFQNLTHKFVVNSAVPAEKKSYPVRWLIVTVSTLSALFLAVIALILFEQIPAAKPVRVKQPEYSE